MNDNRCPTCTAPRDPNDNFCRRCGRQIIVNLPVERPPALPAETGGIPPSIVGGVAVLAAGTALEWLARRLAGGVARGATRAAGRALVGRGQAAAANAEPAAAVTVREVLYVREVNLR